MHTFLLGMATVRESALPLVGAGDALSGFVWLLAIVYLYVELTSGERAMGAFIAPFIAVLSLARRRPAPSRGRGRPSSNSPLFVFHVTFVLFAYASFAIAAVMGAHLRAAVPRAEGPPAGGVLRPAAVAAPRSTR